MFVEHSALPFLFLQIQTERSFFLVALIFSHFRWVSIMNGMHLKSNGQTASSNHNFMYNRLVSVITFSIFRIHHIPQYVYSFREIVLPHSNSLILCITIVLTH